MGWAHPARTLEHPSKPVLCLVVGREAGGEGLRVCDWRFGLDGDANRLRSEIGAIADCVGLGFRRVPHRRMGGGFPRLCCPLASWLGALS